VEGRRNVLGVRARGTVPVEVLRVRAGLTREPEACSKLQSRRRRAFAVQRPGTVGRHRGAGGAAALAAVARAGIWDATLEIADRIPTGERPEPGRGGVGGSNASRDGRES